MYIRCLDCQSSTWLESLESLSASREVSCQSCGHGYKLEIPEELGSTQREQYQRALGFAEESGIDLPSAYSVLLGIMSLEDARSLGDQPVNATMKAATARTDASRARTAEQEDRSRRSAAAIQPSPTPRRRHEPAVGNGPGRTRRARGARVEAQAPPANDFENRNRLLLAAKLAQKHHLPMKLAHDVVGNRISLHAALVERDTLNALRATRKPITASQRLGVAVVMVLLVAGVAAYGLKTWTSLGDEARSVAQLSEVATQKATAEANHSAAAKPAHPFPSGSEEGPVVTDEQGRVVAVSGPDPRSVLLRFCEASKNDRLEPLALAPAVPPFPGSRLGVFRNFNQLNSLFTISIQRNSRTRSWQAGDGVNPIAANRTPEQPSGATPIRTEAR